MGLSYDKTELAHPLLSASNAGLIALWKLLGNGLVRIGGDSTDQMTYQPNGNGQTWPYIAPSDIAQFAGFIKAVGWKCLYSVNLAGVSNGAQTPALAAAEVAYVAEQLGPLLYGIEIGNEPDAYATDSPPYFPSALYPNPWTPAEYESIWASFRDAILAETPGVFITGPAGGHLSAWTIPFSEYETSANLGLLTDHYYRLCSESGCSTPTTSALIAYPDPTLISNLQLMQTAQQTTGIPYRISETNSVSGGFAGVANAYASALWSIDHFFTIALGGATGVNFTGSNDLSNGNYAPIQDNEVNVVSVQPEYYGILLCGLAGTGTLYTTTLSTGSSENISAYAVKTSSGLNIVVSNKTTENLTLTIQLPEAVHSASLMEMTQLTAGESGPDLSALSGVTIQGATVGINGSFAPGPAYGLTVSGAQVTCYVPELSAVLLQTT
jgi:hypothetical protein